MCKSSTVWNSIFTLAILALFTSKSFADTMICKMRLNELPGDIETSFALDNSKPSQIIVEGSFGRHIAPATQIGNSIFLIESDGDASSSTIIVINENDIIAARSTITSIGYSNIKPLAVTSTGDCRITQGPK